MIPTDEAHFAGFMEGVDLVQGIVARELARARDRFQDFSSIALKRIQDKVALKVAERMEAA